MNEYESRLKSISNEIVGTRQAGGNTAMTMMFGLLSVMKSKNKITDKDLDVICEVEKKGMSNTLDSLFANNFGDPEFKIKNEEELQHVKDFCNEHVDNIKSFINSSAADIKPEKKQSKTKE